MAKQLKISTAGLNFIIKEEGIADNVYNDPVGVQTIGIGHALTKSERSSGKIRLSSGEVIDFRNGLSYEQIMNLLLDDVSIAEDAVERFVSVALEQHQLDALVSFTFNLGSGALERSTLLKLLNKGAYDQIPNQIKRWNKGTVKGKKVVIGGKSGKDGLVGRRRREAEMWQGQNPAANTDHLEPRPDEYTTSSDGETLPVWDSSSGALVPVGGVIQHQPDTTTAEQSAEMIEFLQWKEDQANSKPTLQSKIIGTAGAMIASGLMAKYGLDLSPELVSSALMYILMGGGALIAYFRKFKTTKAKLS